MNAVLAQWSLFKAVAKNIIFPARFPSMRYWMDILLGRVSLRTPEQRKQLLEHRHQISPSLFLACTSLLRIH